MQPLGLAEVNALGYKRLRRLERVCIDFSIYYVTTCTRNRKSVLANDEAARILVDQWVRLTRVMAGLLGDMSSCLITFISFAEVK